MSYLLVPGAGGDEHFWHLLVPLLEADGEPVVAVRLPAGDESAGWAEYADVVAAAGRDLTDVVLVAQSMGAFSAPLACDRLDVTRIVLVNPMTPAPGETAGEWWQATGQSAAWQENERAEGRDPEAEFDVRVGFFHDVPDDVTDDFLSREEPAQADRPFGEPWPLDAWPDLPTTVVAGREDRLFPVAFQQRLNRERLGVEPRVVPGGHLTALSHPDLVAVELRRP
ncbi:MAG: alpha/beta hydrolase [Nocardioides sp.]